MDDIEEMKAYIHDLEEENENLAAEPSAGRKDKGVGA